MKTSRAAVPGLVARFAGRLRFPALFVLTAALFLLDLILPDLVPFVDEIILGLATLLFAAWKKRKEDPTAPPPPVEGDTGSGRVIDVTPRDRTTE